VRDDLQVGKTFPDLELPDHTGAARHLSELTADHPTVANFYRGWWCPKEQRFLRNLVELQEEMEVAYTRIVSITVDPPRSPRRSEPGWAPAGRSCPMPTGPCSATLTSRRPRIGSTGRSCHTPSYSTPT